MSTQSTQASKSKNPSKAEPSFAELFEASQNKVKSLRRNQEVVGIVVSVSPTEILIDVGAKSEGIVTGRELHAVSDLVAKIAIGDKVDATVISPESDAGQVVLSLRKLSGEKRWTELEDKKENNEDIEVIAQEVNRGGVICDFLGIRGFLPASQLAHSGTSASTDSGETLPSKLEQLIGKILSVRVIEVDRLSNRLILSQKTLDKKDLSRILSLLSKINIGEKLSGVVTAVLPFGIFVEVDITEETEVTKEPKEPRDESTSVSSGTSKLEGLVHISELSWEKTDEPSTLFKVGDKVDVMVIAKDEETGRLNLSIKQLLRDPFEESAAKLNKDENVKGSVARITPYGVVVTLEDSLEGLIHISKIPPDLNLEVGQEIDCSVDSVDIKSRRITLVPVVRAKPILYR
ncbi:MAG: S1 RNA-binding domain-containing protein [Patescibacteria group bacterium]